MKKKEILEKAINLDKENGTLYSQVDGLSLQNLFYVANGYFPNCYMFTRPQKSGDTYFDTPAFLNHLKEIEKPEDEMMTVVYSTFDVETKEEKIGFSVIFPKKNIYARVENCISEAYVLYGPDNHEDLHWFVNELVKFYKETPPEKNNIFLLSQTQAGFGLNKWNINEVKNFSIDKQYNDDFKHNNEIIEDFMDDDNKSGLIILHGEKGTGKSTYIRHLVSSYTNKKFVFIHSGLISLLGEPAFNNFLLSLSDSVIILEDCEDALKARKTAGSTAAVGILLNMTDGLLADNLHIKFICTFNEDISNIDSALLRKGRLVCKYEFGKLSADKSNQLLEELYGNEIEVDEAGNVTEKKVPKTTKPLTLADIYNWNEDSFEKERKSII